MYKANLAMSEISDLINFKKREHNLSLFKVISSFPINMKKLTGYVGYYYCPFEQNGLYNFYASTWRPQDIVENMEKFHLEMLKLELSSLIGSDNPNDFPEMFIRVEMPNYQSSNYKKDGQLIIESSAKEFKKTTLPMTPKYMFPRGSFNQVDLPKTLEIIFDKDIVERGISEQLASKMEMAIKKHKVNNEPVKSYHLTLRGFVQDVSLRDALDKIIGYLSSAKGLNLNIKTIEQSEQNLASARKGKSILNSIHDFYRVDLIIETEPGIMQGLRESVFKKDFGLNILVANEETFKPSREGGRELVVFGTDEFIAYHQIGGVWNPVFKEVSVQELKTGNIPINFLAEIYQNSNEKKQIDKIILETNDSKELINKLSQQCSSRNTINILITEMKKNSNNLLIRQALNLIRNYFINKEYRSNKDAYLVIFNTVIQGNDEIADKYIDEFMRKIEEVLK